jgi:hypothetical protein
MPREIIRSSDPRISEILRLKKDYKSRVPNDRSLHRVLPDYSWSRQPCFIVGGGSSLKGFDFERLRGKGKIIAVNRAYLDCPFADLLVFMDKSRFYRWAMENKLDKRSKQKFEEFKGLKAYVYMRHDIPNVYLVPRAGKFGLSTSLEEGIYIGTNSGYSALSIALCLGANPIYLLGFDMKYSRDEKGKPIGHYHKTYPEQQVEQVVIDFRKGYIELAPELKLRGRRVINLNPDSGLTCFEFQDIEEVL